MYMLRTFSVEKQSAQRVAFTASSDLMKKCSEETQTLRAGCSNAICKN